MSHSLKQRGHGSLDVPQANGEVIGAGGHSLPAKGVALEPADGLGVASQCEEGQRRLSQIPTPDSPVHSTREDDVLVILAPGTGEDLTTVGVDVGSAGGGAGGVPYSQCLVS